MHLGIELLKDVAGAEDLATQRAKGLGCLLGLELELASTIPNGTKASAAGLSGCACVTCMRSGEKGEVLGQTRKCKALE